MTISSDDFLERAKALISQLRDISRTSRSNAVNGLRHLPVRECTAALQHLVELGTEDECCGALQAMLLIDEKEGIQIAERASLTSRNMIVRWYATGLLWQHGDAGNISTFRQIASHDDDPTTRLVAVAAIGKFGSMEDCELLNYIAREDQGVDEQDRAVALEAEAAVQEIRKRNMP